MSTGQISGGEIALNPDRPSAAVLWQKAGPTLHVRASAVRDCRRALWYAANDTPQEPRTEQSLVQMHAGVALEPVVFRAMRRNGWQTSAFQHRRAERGGRPETRWQATPTLRIEGHPDGVARLLHGVGPWLIAEVKTRGNEQYRWWQQPGGALASHPASVAQMAAYRMGLYGREGINAESGGVLAVLNTHTREWDTEIFAPAKLREVADATVDWLAPLEAMLTDHPVNGLGDTPPARDYQVHEWQCKRCPFLATCRPESVEPAPDESASVSVAQAVGAAELCRQWLDYEDGKPFARTTYDSARDIIRRYMEQEGQKELGFAGAVEAKYIAGRTTRAWDDSKVNAILTAEQIADALIEKTTKGYIRLKALEEAQNE